MSLSTRLHSVRYQRWSGQLGTGYWTWIAMVREGIRQRMKDQRNLLLVLGNLGFVIGACIIFYVLAMLETLVGTDDARGIYGFVKTFLRVDISSVERLGEFRPLLWKTVFVFMLKVQLFYVLLVVARIGPGLIADDLKSNALPIYFARPITPLTYILGKWWTVGIFIGLTCLAPNVLAIFFGTIVAGGLASIGQTLMLTLTLTLIGLGIMLSAGMIILALSSITADKRYALVGWLALLLLPVFAQEIVVNELPDSNATGWIVCLSLWNDALVLVEWALDLRAGWQNSPLPERAYRAALAHPVPPLYAAATLFSVTAAAACICYFRVVRFSRNATSL